MPCTPISLVFMNSKVSSRPRPDCLVALRKVTAAWSAEEFLVLPVGEHHAHGGVGRHRRRPCRVARVPAPTARPRRHGGKAEELQHQGGRLRLEIWFRSRARWPPVIWPLSCAITPMI